MLDSHGDMPSRMPRAVLESRLRGPGDDREAEIFNRRDYHEMGGADMVALAEEILGRAEADCRLS